jgi:hypothetical protein
MDSSQSAATAGTGVGGNGMISSQANDTAATTAVDDPKQNLNQVINSIQKNLGLLHQLSLTVSSFNAASQLPLLQRLYLSTILSIAINSFICYLVYQEIYFCGLGFAAILLLWSSTTWLN